MSVAVIPIQPSYFEPYVHSTLSVSISSNSDSDAGYETPAGCLQGNNLLQLVTKSSDSGEGETMADLDLQERIIRQVEWYFSDDNLLKDSFLMKHINRNKQGYVSLKLVASLRKVKALTKDWTVVLASLKHSTLMSLNEEETKVCRKSPPPQVDFNHIAKTLLITDYPQQEPNLADLEQEFGRYGEVIRVRVITPGRAMPLDVKPFKAHHPPLGKNLSILVEFKSEEVAKSSCKKIRECQSWRDEMKVELLRDKKFSGVGEESKDNEDRLTQSKSLEGKKKKKSKGKDSKTSETPPNQKGRHHSKENSPAPLLLSAGKDSKTSQEKQVFQHRISPPADTRRRWKPQGVKCSPEFSRKYLRPEGGWKDYASDSGLSCGSRSSSESPKMTPEPFRKVFSPESSWRSGETKHHSNSCIIRQPLGPDGTRGFSKQRNILTQS